VSIRESCAAANLLLLLDLLHDGVVRFPEDGDGEVEDDPLADDLEQAEVEDGEPADGVLRAVHHVRPADGRDALEDHHAPAHTIHAAAAAREARS